MKRIEVSRPGGYERLELVERPDLVPDPGTVVVDVRASGVNYADCIVRMGLYESAKKYVGWPITPGFEFAGTVRAIADDVSGLGVGDAVFGVTRFFGYASQVRVPPHQVFAIPDGWDTAQAACFPTVFLTAWYALRELCKLRPGMSVLVHSASGGVGLAALQIARAFGCRPVGVVGAEHKVALARQNGAVDVIDKSRGNLFGRVREAAPGGYHVALDPNGEETLMGSYRALRPTGRLIVYGFSSMISKGKGRPSYAKLAYKYLKTPRFNPILMTGSNKAVMAFNLSYLFEESALLSEAMSELLGLVGKGWLTPLPVRRYALADAGRAHRDLESGNTIGKLVLMLGEALD